MLLKETVNTSFKAYEIFGTEILTRSDLDSQSNWFNREKIKSFFNLSFIGWLFCSRSLSLKFYSFDEVPLSLSHAT